jgi:hypothetical protein
MNARNNKYFTMRFRQKVGLNEMRRLTDDFQWGVSLRHVHVRPWPFLVQMAPTMVI